MAEWAGADETLDVLCNDRLQVIQKKGGYRLSLDPLLLANFVRLKKDETLLDVGTGCGIIPLYMSKRGAANKLTGIEIQDELYNLALRNKALNACANVEFVRGDARVVGKGLGPFHVVVSNPPYVKAAAGRKSPAGSRLIARYESTLDLAVLLSLASSLLFTHGRLCLIYPAKRMAEVMYASRARNLEPKRLRLVHPRVGAPAALSLVECVKGGGPHLRVEPPLYIYTENDYTQEVKTYYA